MMPFCHLLVLLLMVLLLLLVLPFCQLLLLSLLLLLLLLMLDVVLDKVLVEWGRLSTCCYLFCRRIAWSLLRPKTYGQDIKKLSL